MSKFNYFVSAFLLIFLASCGNEEKPMEQDVFAENPKTELLNRINQLEAKMHQSPEIVDTIAAQALQAYIDYSQSYPKDSITPDYLFKSAEIATAIKKYSQAYSLYKTIADRYPDYKLVTESLFLEASLLDNYLNEDDKAKLVYEDLIKKYPESPYANDAKAAISNLGKSDADLIKEFKKKNGEK